MRLKASAYSLQPEAYSLIQVAEGPIKTRSRLGGLLNYYYRKAA